MQFVPKKVAGWNQDVEKLTPTCFILLGKSTNITYWLMISWNKKKIEEWRISLWWLVNVVTLPLLGTPSSPVWYPIISCLESHLHLVYHHLNLVYHHLNLVYHPPVWYPTIHVWYPTISVWYPTIPIWYATIPVWYPTTLLEPHPCLEPHHVSGTPFHPLSGIPPQCPSATILPAVPYPPLAIAASIWPLTAPYPLIWLLPTHHLELLLHATPLPPATAIWPSCTLPSSPSWPSGPPCPTTPTPSGSLPSTSCLTTPAIWPSYPTTLLTHHPHPLLSPSSPVIWHS